MTAYIQGISRASAFVRILEDNLGYSPLVQHAGFWEKMPVLVAHRVIAAERPGFTTPFKEYAETGIEYVIGGDDDENQFRPATAARRAIAAYVYLHSTPGGSLHEPEAIGLFTEKLIHHIEQNNGLGVSNVGAYLLFKSAARLELEPGVVLTSHELARRAMLLESWPVIIAKTTEPDHISTLPNVLHTLADGNHSKITQTEILNLLVKRSRQVTDTNKNNCKVLMMTLTNLEKASAAIADDKQALKIQAAWQNTFDALDHYDPRVSYSWAQNLAQSRRPVHASIRHAAAHVVQTYKPLNHPHVSTLVPSSAVPCYINE